MATSCAMATGASLTGVTVMETGAGAESTVPSLTVKVKLSVPFEFVAGVYDKFCAVPLSVPFVGSATMV